MLVDVILPVFLLIGFGYAAVWAGLFNETAVDGLMRFAQNFAVPVLLFASIARLDLATHFDPRLLFSFYVGAFSGFALAWLGARALGRSAEECVAIGFCGLFSNSLLLGVPITERAYGPAALAGNFVIISIHSPLLYTFGITVMEFTRARGTGLSTGQTAIKALAGVVRTPLVIGIAAGMAMNLTQRAGIVAPKGFWAAVEMMSKSALPAALFGLGGVLYRYRPEGDARVVGFIVAASLIVHPALTYGLGRAIGLSVGDLRSAVMTAAMAPGVNTYLFANMYGAARRVAATGVLIGTALSILTIWGWLAILP